MTDYTPDPDAVPEIEEAPIPRADLRVYQLNREIVMTRDGEVIEVFPEGTQCFVDTALMNGELPSRVQLHITQIAEFSHDEGELGPAGVQTTLFGVPREWFTKAENPHG